MADRATLVRGRLIDQLRRRWFVPVTVVTAPAGYGKTTLLAQAVAANAEAPLGIDCWLTCEPDPTLSSFGEALSRAVDAHPSFRADGPDVERLATGIVEAMWRRSPQQVVLVLDDVHELAPGSEAAALLTRVVATLPDNGHVLLSGRTPPAVPLARMEVEGRVAHLGEDELAFTEAELAAFAELRQVSSEKVAGSGGWPALAELSVDARTATAGDYIGQEVLDQLTADRRRDLALLAHLDSFDQAMAEAVLGPAADADALVAGLPLVSRHAGGEYSLHGLLRSLLANEAGPDEVAEARRRAGRSLLEAGRVDAGMRMLIDAEAWDEVAHAIVVALGVAHPPVARDVLEAWYKLLPPHLRDGPSGRLLAAVVAVEGDMGGASEDFEDCAAEFHEQGEFTGELACIVQLGQLAWWSDDAPRLAGVAARAFALEAQGVEEAVPFATLGRALIYDIADESRRMLAELDRIPPGSLSEPWMGLVDWSRAIGHLQLGNLPEAQAASEAALTYAGTLHAPVAQGTRLQALWYQGRLDEVRRALPELLEQVGESGYRNSTVLIGAQCSAAHSLLGRPDDAERYLDHARATATLLPDAPLVDTNLTMAAVLLAMARGDEPAAADIAERFVERHPIGVGLPVAAQRRHVALLYVLVPATRPVWDEADIGPAWQTGRALAQAVVAVRAGRRLPDATPLADPHVVRAHLPAKWVAELGVAALAAGRPDAWDLLDATWPDTRPAVADLADEGRAPLRKAAREVLGRLPVPPTARRELRLLGPVELLEDGVADRSADWRRERVRSLLAYLALHGTVSRGQLADDLWPALDPEAQSRNLRVTLTYLLKVLEPERGRRDASFFVRQHGGNVSLHPGEALTVDVWDFDRHCQASAAADERGQPAAALEHALAAVDLWRGEPTELLSDEWAVAPFEQRRRQFTLVATRAGELLLARGRYDRVHALAEAALELDPWLEPAHRLVVAGHRAAGFNLAAQQALRRYREAVRELGMSPDQATLMVERLVDSLPA
ncbi:MAG TPA: BTAD domain-containing putative transcriptional regulator [Acidimicrobiales bacterium]